MSSLVMIDVLNEESRENWECEIMYDLVVIGAGVTGYGAAMYAARLDLSVAVIGDVDGGTITLTDDVANYPGFIQLTGKELSDNLKAHTLDYPVLKISFEVMRTSSTLLLRISHSSQNQF